MDNKKGKIVVLMGMSGVGKDRVMYKKCIICIKYV